ncbi:hypothetical protein Tco_0255973 [Tanacetum coccineum]
MILEAPWFQWYGSGKRIQCHAWFQGPLCSGSLRFEEPSGSGSLFVFRDSQFRVTTWFQRPLGSGTLYGFQRPLGSGTSWFQGVLVCVSLRGTRKHQGLHEFRDSGFRESFRFKYSEARFNCSGSGVTVIQAAAKLGCLVLKCPFYYLGTRVGGSMTRVQAWQEIVEKVKSRLSKWKSKTLSIGGSFKLFPLAKRLSLWTKVIVAIHGVGGKIHSEWTSTGKSCWLSILSEVRSLQRKGMYVFDYLTHKMGNGESTNILATRLVCSLRRIPRGGIERIQFDNWVALFRSALSYLRHDQMELESGGVPGIFSVALLGDVSMRYAFRILDLKG